jgi:hypothetical protein
MLLSSNKEIRNNIMSKSYISSSYGPNRDQQNAAILSDAINRKDVKKAESLLKAGVNPNIINKASHSLKTPLHLAAQIGSKEIVQLLIDHGANIDASEGGFTTPLHYAVSGGYTDIVQLLLERGTDIRAVGQGGRSPLHSAAQHGNTPILKLLLQHGAHINANDSNGLASMHLAACYGHQEAVTSLIQSGADVNAMDNGGKTPLHYAIENKHEKVIKILLVAGAALEANQKDLLTRLLNLPKEAFTTLFEQSDDQHFLLKDRAPLFRKPLDREASVSIANIFATINPNFLHLTDPLANHILPRLSVKDIGALLCTAKPAQMAAPFTLKTVSDRLKTIISEKEFSFADAIKKSQDEQQDQAHRGR